MIIETYVLLAFNNKNRELMLIPSLFMVEATGQLGRGWHFKKLSVNFER